MIDRRSELHAFAREQAERMEAAGAVFRRKLLRFNDVVETGVRYACCCANPRMRVAAAGVIEALRSCADDDPMAGGPAGIVPDWMLTHDPAEVHLIGSITPRARTHRRNPTPLTDTQPKEAT